FEDKSSELSRSRAHDLEMDVDVMRSGGIDIDPEIQEEIDECFAYADALRDRGINARVVVEAIDREEIEMGMRGIVEVRVNRVTHLVVVDDITEPAQEGAVEVMYSSEREIRQVQRFRFYDRMRISRLEACARRHLGYLNKNGGNGNGGNRNGGNGNGGNGNRGNGNGRGNGYNFRGFMPARECTYQDFLKCQPLSFNETEGFVGLTPWFEKMETVFHISNCPESTK
ncbi:hypothetical protein Tco_1489888, partial [Tanacetum coccineum]